MNAQDIINFIHNAEKKTPVKVYYRAKTPVDFPNCHQFGDVVFGDWKDIEPVLKENQDNFLDVVIENDCRNSAVPLLDMKNIRARIEPGAIIRDQVEIGDNAVIMMGAIINIGAIIGEGTMIDMGGCPGRTCDGRQELPYRRRRSACGRGRAGERHTGHHRGWGAGRCQCGHHRRCACR